MTTPTVSVVIAAYTQARWDDLRAAVASLQKQTLPPREIIVVVDYNPALLARVREQIPNVLAIANTEPRGLSGARNCGVAAARGDLIAFLDDDAIAAPDWLERVVEHFADPEVLGVGGFAEPLWSSAPPRWFPEEFYWVIGCSYRGMPEQVASVRNLFGGNMCIRRALFDAVGGFQSGIGRDRYLLKGCEETEFCIRARQSVPHGKFLYAPHARIGHHVSPSRHRLSYFAIRCYSEGLSKATVARLRGAHDGLASERTYTLQVLPRALLRNLQQTILRRDAAGILKAGAILIGLGLTTLGFLVGTMASWRAPRLTLDARVAPAANRVQ
jgi:GT2 family glycosyltransferase